MIDAVIFDMDGLLADTEGIHAESWIRTFRERSFDLSLEAYKEHWIRLGKTTPDFVEMHNLPLDPYKLLNRKAEIFSSLLDGMLRPMPGAYEILEALSGKTKMGLASSSRRVTVDLILARLDMKHFFEHRVAYEDVQNPKPHPEPFIVIAERMGVEPARCLVLEDAEKGVIAAHEAGMKCIAIPTEHTIDNDFSKATFVVNSLADLTWERIRSL